MKIRVTRIYEITTEHDIKVSEEPNKMDIAISLAIESNTNVLDTIRNYKNVVDAGCLGNSHKDKIEIVFPTHKKDDK